MLDDILERRSRAFPFLLVGILAGREYGHTIATRRRGFFQGNCRIGLLEPCEIPEIGGLPELVAEMQPSAIGIISRCQRDIQYI